MICETCKDKLTDGEYKTHLKKPYFAKMTCFQCSQKQLQKVINKYKLINKLHEST